MLNGTKRRQPVNADRLDNGPGMGFLRNGNHRLALARVDHTAGSNMLLVDIDNGQILHKTATDQQGRFIVAAIDQ